MGRNPLVIRTSRGAQATANKSVVLALCLLLTGCSSLFFWPADGQHRKPDELGLAYEEVQLTTPDAERLHGWWLPAQGDARGTVYYLHGNAQNISTHVLNVGWLPPEGYNVFLLDYRGFGASTGSPTLTGALRDSLTGLEWVIKQSADTPVAVLGQSIGGSLAIQALTDPRLDADDRPQALVVDGAFAGFRMIARETLNASWLTWPFQAPLSKLVPEDREPVNLVVELNLPLLVIHSREDQIVPFHHGKKLFEAATEPKQFMPTATSHVATFDEKRFRRVMLDFMRSYLR